MAALEGVVERRAGESRWAIDRASAPWLAVGAVALACFVLRDRIPWLLQLPGDLTLPLGAWIDAAMAWFVAEFRWLFRAISWLLDQPLLAIRGTLSWLPWPVTIGAFVLVAYYASGVRLALFVLVSLVYVLVVGYWDKAMLTLALVGAAVPVSIAVGLAVGVLAARSRLVRRVVEPTLDLAQAIPAFAYIIPILLLFGLTPMVAVVTSAIYAVPPMVRNVMLGISRVPVEVVESARMSGTSSRQLLWWVELPSALPTVLLGVNQTIMAAFTLVVFTAIVGGTADIGYEVLWQLRKSNFGESLLAGVVITLFAMMVDRTSRGYAARRSEPGAGAGRRLRLEIGAAVTAAVALVGLAELLPVLRAYPPEWVVYPAQALNDAVIAFTTTFFELSERIKELSLFFYLFPIRIGLENSVRPHVWGFELTPTVSGLYAAIIVSAAVIAGWLWRWRASVAVVVVGGLYYFGTMGTPWPVFILVVTLLAWQVGGWRIACFTLGAFLFMLMTGIWQAAMMSVYLCLGAVILCFLIGGAIGVCASKSAWFSAFLRPINDTLQTIPLFVFLIPVVMVFLHGDFSAVIAIMMYAIVPAIRYTEFGIRNVPGEIVEAARAFGCTRTQLLLQVELPLALPEIMLGLNQVIVYALSMLIVTSLLGTKDLGQAIYEALTRAETGKGLVAGFAIAFIAMIADRIIQAWSKRKKKEYGLA